MANISVNLSYTDTDGNLDAATQAAVQRIINGGTPGLPLVTLSPLSLSVAAGLTVSCTVLVTDLTGAPLNNVTVGLSTNDATIALVDDTTGTQIPSLVTGIDGKGTFLVFGVAAGNTVVTATALGVTATATIVVGTGTPTLTLLPSTITVPTSGTTPLFVHLLDGNNNPIASQVVNLASSVPGVATVPASVTTDATGSAQFSVTAVAAGQTVVTASALNVQATASATVQAPPSGAQITIGYTDFLSPTMSPTAANAMLAFIAGKTNHNWKIMNGLTPSGGYPSNVVQIRYMLMEQTKCYDGTASIFTQQSDDYQAYCTAHSVDPEDGYLHYLSGVTTNPDVILTFASNGTITLKYDTQTRAQVYAVGQTVTTAGNSNPLCNGTWTVTNVTAPVTPGGSATIQVNATTGNSGTGGTVSRTGDGTKTLPNRVITTNGNFTPMWHINPKSTVRKSYELDRLPRVLAASYGYGVFIDSMSPNIFQATRATVEYNPANESQYYTDMATLIAALRATMGSGPWRYTINTGNYNTSFITQLITAAGSAHMESIITNHSPSQWPGTDQTFVATQLANGSAVEILNDVSIVDSEGSFGAGVYINDPLPAVGNLNAMAYTIQSLICALMVWDGGTGGGVMALNLWNDLWSVPTANTGGIDSKWLGMLDYPFGTPTAASSVLVSGVTDPLGQAVSVSTRAYGNNLVIYRTTSSGTSSWADTAAYTATLPASTGASGKWQRVKSDGTLDAAISTIDLHPMMGAMLVPAGGSVSLAPTSGSVAAGQSIVLTVTVLDATGNPVPSQVVALASSVTADLTVPASVTTDSAGQATFNATGVAAGTSNVTASANSITSSASAITVTAASGNSADSIFAADGITGVANGATLATWTNDADNSRNASEATQTSQPIYEKGELNGLAMVFYPASNPAAMLQFTALAHTAITEFIVFKHPSGSSVSHHGAVIADPGYCIQVLDASSPYVVQFTSHRSTTDGIWKLAAGVALPGTIIEVAYDSASTSNVPVIKINGTTQTVTQVQAPVGTQTSSAGTATIGNDPLLGTNAACYGLIGEITRWNGVLGTADESTEGKRLGTKWAIANSY